MQEVSSDEVRCNRGWCLVAQNLEQVKRERSELHQKLEQVDLGRDLSDMKLDLAKVLDKKGG